METAIRSPRQLAELIKRARTSQNLTQQELADKSGISQVTISKAENAEANTSVSTALTLLSTLGYELVGQPRPDSDPDGNLDASIGGVDPSP